MSDAEHGRQLARALGDVHHDNISADAARWMRWAAKELERRGEHSAWIPCKERMPEPYRMVLVCTASGQVVTANYHPDFADAHAEMYPHWMPLPDPPGAGKAG